MKMEWIKVADRLPNIDQVVICFGDGKRPSVAIYTGVFERFIDPVPNDRIMRVYYDKITVWMPLPEPPKQ
jgi:hypothetical protein